MITHGLSKHPLYVVWCNIKNRCYSKRHPQYKDYGGRKIAVCKRWLNPQKFVDDMFPSFEKNLQIDRINNNGNYSPSNCRWVTRSQNQRNKRNTIFVKYRGRKRLLSELVNELDISRGLLLYRASRNVPLDAPKNSTESKRITTFIKYRGRQVALVELSKKLNISRQTLKYRELHNLSLDPNLVPQSILEAPQQSESQSA